MSCQLLSTHPSVAAEGDVDTSSSGEGSGPVNVVDGGQSDLSDTQSVSTSATESAVSVLLVLRVTSFRYLDVDVAH